MISREAKGFSLIGMKLPAAPLVGTSAALRIPFGEILVSLQQALGCSGKDEYRITFLHATRKHAYRRYFRSSYF
jgi:hypothetical protein